MSATETDSTPSGARLRAMRNRSEMSMSELAHFARVSKPMIQQIENGSVVNASPAIKCRIAHALRTPVQELWPLPDEATDG